MDLTNKLEEIISTFINNIDAISEQEMNSKTYIN
jgi:hypothetical protein